MKKLFAAILSLVLAASLVMGITAAVCHNTTPDQAITLCDLGDDPDLF